MGCCIIGVITWFAFLSCWVSPLAVFEFVLHAACRVVSCSVLSGLWGAMGCAPGRRLGAGAPAFRGLSAWGLWWHFACGFDFGRGL